MESWRSGGSGLEVYGVASAKDDSAIARPADEHRHSEPSRATERRRRASSADRSRMKRCVATWRGRYTPS